MTTEAELRTILGGGDATRLAALLAEDPALATEPMAPWPGHPLGATPLGHVAMLRYDTVSGQWRDVPGTAAMARLLLDAGAPVDGRPGDRETPLITAAGYGDAGVAAVLVKAGATLDTTAAPHAGGVPGGTALLHAAVFGMTAVVDVLARAGATVNGLVEAAAVGDVGDRLRPDTPEADRVLALIMAADHERLSVIDELLAAGTPIDAEDRRWGRQALRLAATNGRLDAVRHLLLRGADPAHRDPERGETALARCRRDGTGPRQTEVQAVLTAAT